MGPVAERFGDPKGVSAMTYQELRYWYGWHKAYADAEREELKKVGKQGR